MATTSSAEQKRDLELEESLKKGTKKKRKKRRYKAKESMTESSGHGLMMKDDGLERVEWMMGHSARGRDKGYLDRDGAFHLSNILSFFSFSSFPSST